MSEWKIGDVVRLKSGGPAMTVDKITEGVVVCCWFRRGEIHSGNFSIELLIEEAIVPSTAEICANLIAKGSQEWYEKFIFEQFSASTW